MITASATGLSASGKRLLILPVKNVTGSADYNYLEPSITEAVEKELHKRFVFRPLLDSEWKSLARKNVLLVEEAHTKTVALQLGLVGRQDVVIGGSFVVEGEKLTASVHVADISQKEIIKEFTVEGYNDSRVWTTVNDIASRVAEEVQGVLPNRDGYKKYGLDNMVSHRIALSAGIQPLGLGGGDDAVQSTAVISPADFTPALNVRVDYMLLNTRPLIARLPPFSWFKGSSLSRIRLLARAGFTAGWSDWQDDGSTIQGNLYLFETAAGLGYEISLGQNFSLVPAVHTGYQAGWYDLTFTGQSAQPLNSSGELQNDKRTVVHAPFVEVGAGLYWLINLESFAVLRLSQKNVFYQNRYNGELLTSLGGGFAF